jgi:hypothetical protein
MIFKRPGWTGAIAAGTGQKVEGCGTMRRDSLRLLPRIAAIGILQIIGWGSTFNLPGMLGDRIAADLGFSLTVALLARRSG